MFQTMKPEELKQLFVEEQYQPNLIQKGDETLIGVRTSYNVEQLKLAAMLSKDDFLKPYRSVIQCINGMFVLFSCVLLVLLIFILNKSLLNLKKLSRQMEGIQDGCYEVVTQIQSRDEVGMLASSFYRMMDQIRDNMNRIHDQDEREKQIEYSLMVSQIDPHFIYNTLNTITYLAELNQTKDIMVINKALIGMLRDRLKMTRLQTFDTLDKEKQQLEAYMTIQNYLCNNETVFEMIIPDHCEKLEYPKNILQPFVENSILHGILLHRDQKGMLIPGKITIVLEVKGDRIVTLIKDNGIGMTQEMIRHYFIEEPGNLLISKTDSSEHIGIYNIRVRLAYLYGDQLEMKVNSPADGGTEITLSFPKDCSSSKK